ncbi:hypothetical protein [Microterricola pindariensis]|uniref:hypothetical protein n=1 Tax=Microterricola pindariensis TaxID=478010 RepID=UPI00105719EE|nr:hypothetical protein [Microterricola pindariensis]
MTAPLLLLHAWGRGPSTNAGTTPRRPARSRRWRRRRWRSWMPPGCRAVLLGSSSGGYVAQQVAVVAPERLAAAFVSALA